LRFYINAYYLHWARIESLRFVSPEDIRSAAKRNTDARKMR
jgi:hypothetical protein